jgi:2-polyprenyl-6-methoxyphenol hydroxylase-like FAD-dependent oxidoreductase
VKPYFGLGANSALEDVIALQSCLDQSPLDHPASALKHFSKLRGPEAKALVTISRGFDRPGVVKKNEDVEGKEIFQERVFLLFGTRDDD